MTLQQVNGQKNSISQLFTWSICSVHSDLFTDLIIDFAEAIFLAQLRSTKMIVNLHVIQRQLFTFKIAKY